jgi:hypothetical protein
MRIEYPVIIGIGLASSAPDFRVNRGGLNQWGGTH